MRQNYDSSGVMFVVPLFTHDNKLKEDKFSTPVGRPWWVRLTVGNPRSASVPLVTTAPGSLSLCF